MDSVLILGASSEISKAVARLLANDGHNIILASRNVQSLQGLARDIELRFQVSVELVELDMYDVDVSLAFLETIQNLHGVVCAVGTMEGDADHILRVNFTGVVMMLEQISHKMMHTRGRGGGWRFIAAIGSVAGDRGRAKNHLYCSAKAGLHAYLSGLRSKLHRHKIQVITVKPGFVETKMTRGMNLPQRLTARPDQVAHDMHMAIKSRKDVIYSMKRWWLVMFVIKIMPEFVFKRLKI